jgi:YgiT-type zinc finger domain-containing protein
MKTCYFCGGELVAQMTTFVHEAHGEVQVIRNVPAYVCQQCGEREYTQETTHQLLTFLQQPPQPVEILQVPAYDLKPVLAQHDLYMSVTEHKLRSGTPVVAREKNSDS